MYYTRENQTRFLALGGGHGDPNLMTKTFPRFAMNEPIRCLPRICGQWKNMKSKCCTISCPMAQALF